MLIWNCNFFVFYFNIFSIVVNCKYFLGKLFSFIGVVFSTYLMNFVCMCVCILLYPKVLTLADFSYKIVLMWLLWRDVFPYPLLYRWLFLRKEQSWCPNSTFQNLKSLFSSLESTKTKYFIAFPVQQNVSRHIWDKKSLFLWILLEKLKISNFEIWSLEVPFQKKSPVMNFTSCYNCYVYNSTIMSMLIVSHVCKNKFPLYLLDCQPSCFPLIPATKVFIYSSLHGTSLSTYSESNVDFGNS